MGHITREIENAMKVLNMDMLERHTGGALHLIVVVAVKASAHGIAKRKMPTVDCFIDTIYRGFCDEEYI